MSEIRSSRIDNRSSRESLIPNNTFHTSRNQINSSRVESFGGKCPYCKSGGRIEGSRHRDKKMKRKMRNINELIKNLESKFDDKQSQLNSFDLHLNSDDEEDGGFEEDNEDRDLVDIDVDKGHKQDDEKREDRRDCEQPSGYKSASSYTYKASFASPDREENNLNSYLTN